MTTHYAPTEQGGIRFISERRPGEVRIPNYVYDIWMPLIGSDAMGIYAVYCRLEREGTVKAITQQRLAQEMRIGVGKLTRINDLLEKCGFIKVRKPQKQARLMHWTTEVTVCDPAREIPAALIKELKHPKGYEPLCPWLTATEVPEIPNSISDDTKQSRDEIPNSNAFVAPLDVAPSEVEESATALPAHADDIATFYGTDEPPQENPADAYKKRIKTKLGDTWMAAAAHTEQRQAVEGQWTVPKHGTLSPQCATFKEATGYAPVKVWREDIDEHIPGDDDSLHNWYKVCHAYVGCGWNPRNVQAMLDYYNRGEIPSTTPNAKGVSRRDKTPATPPGLMAELKAATERVNADAAKRRR